MQSPLLTEWCYQEKDAFYAKYKYERPSDVLPFILENSQQGDSSDVLRALDCFGTYYPNYRLGPTKGDVFEDIAGVYHDGLRACCMSMFKV